MEHTIILKKEDRIEKTGFRRGKRGILLLLLLPVVAVTVLNLGLFQWTDLYERPSDLEMIFLLDKSISMAGEPLDTAEECIWQSIGKLRENTPVSLVTFSDRAEISLPLSRDHEKIYQALSELKAGGITDISAGLAEAEKLFATGDEDAVQEIFLLTDGRNGKERILPQIAKKLRESGIRVYIVGILGDENPSLARLAADTGGEFIAMGEELNRVLLAVRSRQEGRRIMIFLMEGIAEAVFLILFLFLLFKELPRKKNESLPNAGYLDRREIADVMKKRH